MDRVFIDTDIALDLLGKREPFYDHSARLFSLSDRKEIEICISALSFSNLNYLLSRQYNSFESRRILNQFNVIVSILAVDHKIIELALSSKFKDFEDSIQYHVAIANGINTLLTRNIKGYKEAEIAILTAQDYIESR